VLSNSVAAIRVSGAVGTRRFIDVVIIDKSAAKIPFCFTYNYLLYAIPGIF